jgi:transcriptional regulator with XRE-family HTH domain
MVDLAKALGEKIRSKRRELGIAQEKLALLTEIDRSYVSRIERGKVNMTVDKLYKFAEVLNCKAADLLP